MKLTITALVAIAAAFSFTGSAFARHDDNPHGYNKQTAAAIAQAQATRPVYLGVGPRAHDSPLRHVTLKSLWEPKGKVTSTLR